MKSKILKISHEALTLIGVALVSLLGACNLYAQSSGVYTDPVGVMRIVLKSGSDSRIGAPLDRSHVYEGRVDSVDGNTIVVSGSTVWEVGAWAPEYPEGDSYYLVFMTGEEEGMSLPVTGNSGNSLSLDLGNESLVNIATRAVDGIGDIIRIVPYWTPKALFENAQIPDQAIMFLFDSESESINKSPEKILTYWQGAGWYDGSFGLADNLPIERGSCIMVRLPSGGVDVELYFTGDVPLIADRKRIPVSDKSAMDYSFSISDPIGSAIGESGLGLSDGTILFEYDNTASGINKAPSDVYTYYSGYGWYDGNFNMVDTTCYIDPLKSYILRVPEDTVSGDLIVSRVPLYLSE
jgi:uncharacterized protein (TIGR02597 family)